MSFDPTLDEGKIAIAFIVFSFVLLVILLITCIVCYCWRYSLHQRKQELKYKNAEQGILTPPRSNNGECCGNCDNCGNCGNCGNCCGTSGNCCGCWVYCCRGCRGCCDHPYEEKIVSANPPTVGPPVTVPVTGGGGCGCGNKGNQFGLSKDIYVYNNSSPSTGIISQPVNFNNRWSSSNDGRLVLNGASPYAGGIYPTVPGGVSSNQFLLNRGR